MKKVIKKIKNGWNILRHKGVRAFIEILLGQTKVVFRSIYFSTNNNKKSCARRLSQFSSDLASSHLVLPPLVFNPHLIFLIPIGLFNFIWYFFYAFEKFIAKPNQKIILISLPKILFLLFLLAVFNYLKPDLINFKILLLSFLLCAFDFLYLLKFILTQLKRQFKKI